MESQPSRSAWRSIDAGVRPSIWIQIGTFLLAGGFIADRLVRRDPALTAAETGLANVPLLVYSVGLIVLGSGFFATVGRPFLGVTGWFPGLACWIQAACALTLLVPLPEMARVTPLAAILKYSSFAVFAIQEHSWIGTRSCNALLVVSIAEFLKILARVSELFTESVSQALDAVLIGVQVAVLWHLGRRIKLQEDLWASERLRRETTGWDVLPNHDDDV
jgi:hypothetical protein